MRSAPHSAIYPPRPPDEPNNRSLRRVSRSGTHSSVNSSTCELSSPTYPDNEPEDTTQKGSAFAPDTSQSSQMGVLRVLRWSIVVPLPLVSPHDPLALWICASGPINVVLIPQVVGSFFEIAHPYTPEGGLVFKPIASSTHAAPTSKSLCGPILPTSITSLGSRIY